jgi:hypothetical protein
MSNSTDTVTRELSLLDPVTPGELEAARHSAAADELLTKILAAEVEAAPAGVGAGEPPRHGDRPRRPGRARAHGWARPAVPLTVLAAAVVAAVGATLVLMLGSQHGDGGDALLVSSLDRAAAKAAAQSPAAVPYPFTYLKTRELSVRTTDRDSRTWSVSQRATRQEWVAWDGSGRLRVATGPARFVAAADRTAWEAAGRPDFLALGFNPRTEERWLEAGMLDRRVEELPLNPAALAVQLRDEVQGARGDLPAAMLQKIAEDLRNPAASPELRSALFQAALRVPGIEYLGPQTDPEGRRGVAVGVTDAGKAGTEIDSLIFDPRTSQVLAMETSAAPAGEADPQEPRLTRAMVYLASRGTDSAAEHGGDWLSGFGPATGRQSQAPFLVYRIEGGEPWSTPHS